MRAYLANFLFVTVTTTAFFTLVGRDLSFFSFSSAGHWLSVKFVGIKI